jgi:aryl-alcohol dehydrogenase-like predicted oxidoreductase
MRTTTPGVGGPAAGRTGLGRTGMSWAYDEPGREAAESVKTNRQAPGPGVTLIGTAGAYRPFTSEHLAGRALAGRRDEAVLAAKAGLVAEGERRMHRNGRPEHIAAALDASLLRLRTDHVNLYQPHRARPAVRLEDSWGAMAGAARAAKARMTGSSGVTPGGTGRARAICPAAWVQSGFSLWSPDVSGSGVLGYTAAHGIALVPFSPLCRGFLTGMTRRAEDLPAGDWRHGNLRFQPGEITADQALAARVTQIADQIAAAPAQLALAWLLAHGQHVVPVPGSKQTAHLLANATAADPGLPADTLAALDNLPAPGAPCY